MATCEKCGTVYKSHKEPGRKCPNTGNMHSKPYKVKKTKLLAFKVLDKKIDKVLKKHEKRSDRTRRRGIPSHAYKWSKLATKRYNTAE